jgi:lipopolysaccharide transport system permease protein
MTTTPDTLTADLQTPAIEAEAVATPDPDAVQLVDHRPSLWEALHDSWRSRHLIGIIFGTAVAAYTQKYRLGMTWIIFPAFMSLVGYALIFGGGVFNVKAPNGMPYFIFMCVGMMGWQLFQQTLTIAARSFLRLGSLVRDVHIPLILVPIAGSAQALIRWFVIFVFYLIAIVYYWITTGTLYLQLAPKYLFQSVSGLFLCVALAWGISLWTAPLTAHTRDVRMVLRFIMPFWFFITPVVYPIEQLHGKMRLLAELNPISAPIEMAKVGLLGAGAVSITQAIWSAVAIFAVFGSGVWFINRFGQRVVGLVADIDDDDDGDGDVV